MCFIHSYILDFTFNTLGGFWILKRIIKSRGIICNWNCIPFDPRPPMEASGIRLGTPALTTRGMSLPEMSQVADWIDTTLTSGGNQQTISRIRQDVLDLCQRYPVPNYNL